MKRYSIFLALLIFLSCNSTQKIATPSLNNLPEIIQAYEGLGKTMSDKFGGIWPDISKEKFDFEASQLASMKNKLAGISINELSTNEKINYDLLKLVVEDRLYLLDFEAHLFPLNSEGGFLAGIIYSTQNQRVTNEADFQKYKDKLGALPTYFLKRTEQIKLGQQKGKSSPKLVVNNCIKLIDALLKSEKENIFFLNAVKENPKWKEEITQLLNQQILPAYQEFNQFLKEDYLTKAPEKVGITEITAGKAFYEQRVRFFTTLDITPKEVFEIGQQEVKRIRGEMEQIIKNVGFKGTFAEFLAFLRTDEQFYPKTPAELLQKAAWITTEMQGKLPQYFGKIPRMPLTVKPVPSALAPNYTGGRYSPGSYNRNRAGQYWVNTYKLESRPYYVLPALSLHEGVPGHHLQMMLSAEIENVPAFRQNTYLSAFGEGWGLYSEYLGKEAGMYLNPYEDFGRLTYEMWRACRLVVDPGMHYMGWTRDQAVDFMANNTALSLHEVNTEIDRYIGWPAQAVSYKIGELKIRELRKLAEKELSDKFDIRAFHDKILENGSVPLSTLERIIKAYIKERMVEKIE